MQVEGTEIKPSRLSDGGTEPNLREDLCVIADNGEITAMHQHQEVACIMKNTQ